MIHTNAYFIFNGADTREYDVLVEALPPIISPAKKVDTFDVTGRSGALHIDEDVYEPYVRTAECALFNLSRLDTVSAWLKGAGRVIFSNEKDKAYDVVIKNQIPFTQAGRFRNRFPVIFECQPLKRAVHEETISLDAPGQFVGKGNVSAAPVITLYGSGSGTVTVNGAAFTISAIQEFVTVNAEIMDCYKGAENRNRYMTGGFPSLYGTGTINAVSWTGNITKIEIQPNWRWI